MAKYKHGEFITESAALICSYLLSTSIGKNAKYAENVVDDDDDAPVYARKVCETTKETEGLDTIIVRLHNGRITVSDEYVRGYTSSFPDRVSSTLEAPNHVGELVR
ncbi:hypothetical protein ANCDUO_00436 [Ancylostoma duodenale]|uniref:Uncharacterized protein n=1 Tax=Ancylostoma duodenale TaxID=51022 RepID=A0A0C2HC43_9BILA|nr:hypothetical protein ANCDUO_00436 [Ancylostoma duodenale]